MTPPFLPLREIHVGLRDEKLKSTWGVSSRQLRCKILRGKILDK